MTQPLEALLARVEGATGPSEELDAQIMAALAAPAGAYAERSRFNGAWCVYEGTTTAAGAPRLWERRGAWHRPEGWPLTASLDAALALVERVLPGWWWAVGHYGPHGLASAAVSLDGKSKDNAAEAKTPALAVLVALLRALISQQKTAQGEG